MAARYDSTSYNNLESDESSSSPGVSDSDSDSQCDEVNVESDYDAGQFDAERELEEIRPLGVKPYQFEPPARSQPQQESVASPDAEDSEPNTDGRAGTTSWLVCILICFFIWME